MRRVNTGDICPICGRQVVATEPEVLEALSAVVDMLERLGVSMEREDHHEPGYL